jgi:hypothetical protein
VCIVVVGRFLSVWGLVHRVGGLEGMENDFENGFFPLPADFMMMVFYISLVI